MALYILNCSVEHPGANSPGLAEELGVNYQESFVELLVEQFLGYEHAIAEYEEEESPGAGSFKKTLHWQLYAPFPLHSALQALQQKLTKSLCLYVDASVASPSFEIHSPPPNI